MHTFGRERFARREFEEPAQYVFRGRSGIGSAGYFDPRATTMYLDTEARFDVAKILIQGPDEIRQPHIVDGFEGQIARGDLCIHQAE